jgi:hypothetical protein
VNHAALRAETLLLIVSVAQVAAEARTRRSRSHLFHTHGDFLGVPDHSSQMHTDTFGQV